MNQPWRYDEDRSYRGYRKTRGTSLIDVDMTHKEVVYRFCPVSCEASSIGGKQ